MISKKNIFLGIDIGTSAIKIVEIKVENKKPVLSNYAWVSFDGAYSKNESADLSHDAIMPGCLKKMITEAKFSGKNAYVSLPAVGGLITLIEFPMIDQKDIEQAIKFEAHKYIPTSLDEVVLSWDIIKDDNSAFNKSAGTPEAPQSASNAAGKDGKKESMEILLVAASKSKVERYENLIKKTGLKLKSLELESFSMVNSLVGNDTGKFIIADIGSRVCSIILIDKGIIRMNRNIDAGGKNITMTIAKSMGIDEARAEKLKLSDKDFFSLESGIDFPSVDIIIAEIKRMLAAAYRGEDSVRIDGVILSGGSASLKGLSGYISRKLDIKVTVGDPFSRITFPQEMTPAINAIKTRFSVAVGLAMRGASDYMKNNK